jgi:predicted patatin/cPLA2 family phospholipase
MSSGANRGAYYAGFSGPWIESGIGFELMGGISAGAIAAAWFAARQWRDMVDSWYEAARWRITPHPVFNMGRWRNVDQLIQRITLRMMDVEGARSSDIEVRLGSSQVLRWPLLRLPEARLKVFSNRDARDAHEFGLMLRATAFVPLMNGLRASIAIDGQSYLDGGLVTRVPVEMIPVDRFDELWIAACSPHGLAELEQRLSDWRRSERLVVITPSSRLPVNRWTLDRERIDRTMAIGRADMEEAVRGALDGEDHVFVGARAKQYRAAVGRA